MAKRRLPAELRRDQIINVVVGLFESQGYHATTMAQIARTVGVTKASLYYYFDSKEQLLAALHEEMMTSLLERQEAREKQGDLTYSEILRRTMHDILGLMESHPGRLRIFFEARRELPPEFGAHISEQRRQYRISIVNTITKGIKTGEFVKCDPELSALALLGMCNWSIQWYRTNGRISAVEIAEHFWRIYSSGLLAHQPAFRA